jgi:hypothetical protein
MKNATEKEISVESVIQSQLHRAVGWLAPFSSCKKTEGRFSEKGTETRVTEGSQAQLRTGEPH